MSSVRPVELPANSPLFGYRRDGGYADCYVTRVSGTVSQAMFVEAFYTSALFKIERALLAFLARRPATDTDAAALAAGTVSDFSAWTVETQSSEQLLLRDFMGKTRSWLMVSANNGDTDLYFGSAVVARQRSGSKKHGLGLIFHALLGFHRLYARLLLGAAASRIRCA